MRVTSDFECGNGKNVAMVRPGHFRLDEVGEKPPYCKYFCFRLEAEGDGGVVRLDVYPDPLLGEAGREGMMGHYPSQIWFSTDEMATWQPLEQPSCEGTHQLPRDAPERSRCWSRRAASPTSPATPCCQLLPPRRLGRGAGGAGAPVRLASLRPQLRGPRRPGAAPAGRGPGAERVFLLGGQHPSEHLGVMAAMGIVEFLLSAHPEAVELRQRYEFWIVPMINVDGNVHGRNGWTMQDVNMFGDFAGAADGAQPRAVEDRGPLALAARGGAPGASPALPRLHGQARLRTTRPTTACTPSPTRTRVYGDARPRRRATAPSSGRPRVGHRRPHRPRPPSGPQRRLPRLPAGPRLRHRQRLLRDQPRLPRRLGRQAQGRHRPAGAPTGE